MRRHRLFKTSMVIAVLVLVFCRVAEIVNVGHASVPSLSPTVSIVFDDGRSSQFDYAYPLMSQRGMKGTFYIITDKIGEQGWMPISEIVELAENGNEIGSHSISHRGFTYLSESEIREECSGSKSLLESYGLKVTNFAYPYGDCNEWTDSIVDDYFDTGRDAYSLLPSLMTLPIAQFHIVGYAGESCEYYELPRLKWKIDQLQPNNWLIVFFHSVEPDQYSKDFTISTQEFAGFLDYLIEKHVEVKTVRDVLSDSEPANAELTLENVRSWFWTDNTAINSVVICNMDGDAQKEVVTGGWYYDGVRDVAQLCVWDVATLALENVKTWYWTGSTYIWSVAVGDVDGDGEVEVVSGGSYFDGVRDVAQLCVWSGGSLALEHVETWFWTGGTTVYSVCVGDVDADGSMEVVSGGYFDDGSRFNAQLVVWSGETWVLEGVQAWWWTGGTYVRSVAVGDVDVDGEVEVVSGGYFGDGVRDVAQLCVWDGGSLGFEGVRTWWWTGDTRVESVAVGDVGGDSEVEVVSGGYFSDGVRDVAQLAIWDGASLSSELVETWYWTSDTNINSVAVGNVDGDSAAEVLTGGAYWDGTRSVAQLCVWK